MRNGRAIVGVVAIFAVGPAVAQTCVPLTRADVYALPKDAVDRAICTMKDEDLRAIQAATEAMQKAGLYSPAHNQAMREQSACHKAYMTSTTLYRERFGEQQPACPAPSAQR